MPTPLDKSLSHRSGRCNLRQSVNELDRTLEARINLYYDLRPGPTAPAPLLIALHGYGANKRQMMREAQLMAPENFAVASLQGFHQHIKEPREKGGPLRFGFGWLTNFRSEESVAIHHRALLDLITVLSDEGIADPARVFLLSAGMTLLMAIVLLRMMPDLGPRALDWTRLRPRTNL